MIKLRVTIDSDGNIIIPKKIREKLGLSPGNFIYVDYDTNKDILTLKKTDPKEIIDWIKKNRRPLVSAPLTLSIEDEFNENISGQ